MKKYCFLVLLTIVSVFAGCSKNDDDNTTTTAPSDYAAAMAGVYNQVSVTTTLWENNAQVDGETLTGTLTLNHSSGDVVEASFDCGGSRYSLTGYCDADGVFHVRPFDFVDIVISEVSSTIKMTGDNTLSGRAECSLRKDNAERRAVIEVVATRG